MTYTIVGLGNPGEEYVQTRHNTGRMLVEWFGGVHGAEWKVDKKLSAHVAKIKIGKHTAVLVLPDTFMNNSGKSLKPIVLTLPAAAKTIVVYDDLDLPFGATKISFNRSSGGHKGVESIIKHLKTEKFARIRVGISPTTPTGKLRKPQGEEAVTKVILGEFKPEEISTLKKLSKKANIALEAFITEGLEKAMTNFN